MNHARLNALLSLVFWSICGIGFFLTLLADGGPGALAEDAPRRLAGAIFLGFGLLVTPLARWLIRRRHPAGQILVDERDERIQGKALMVALIVVVMAVFLTAISLWELHQDTGQVPVGWMWTIAYGTLILANVVAPGLVLLIDSRGWADGG